MPLFEYLDNLPKLSTKLIDEIWYCVKHHPNLTPPEQSQGCYEIYHPSDLLSQFCEQTFGAQYTCRIQVIKEGLLIHKDVGRSIAHNFIVDCGGSQAKTCYYNDQLELIEQIQIELFRWHKLDVSFYHNVINLDHNRVAFTVFIKDQNYLKPLTYGAAPKMIK